MPEKRDFTQCEKCPWLKKTNPHDIPGGYCETKHAALQGTIAQPGTLSATMQMMACHESPVGQETPCTGWLSNQLGAGNNIGLRLWAMRNVKSVNLIGANHSSFRQTLPKKRKGHANGKA